MQTRSLKSALLAGSLSTIAAAAIAATAPAPTPVQAADTAFQVAQTTRNPCGAGSPCAPARGGPAVRGESPCSPGTSGRGADSPCAPGRGGNAASPCAPAKSESPCAPASGRGAPTSPCAPASPCAPGRS